MKMIKGNNLWKNLWAWLL